MHVQWKNTQKLEGWRGGGGGEWESLEREKEKLTQLFFLLLFLSVSKIEEAKRQPNSKGKTIFSEFYRHNLKFFKKDKGATNQKKQQKRPFSVPRIFLWQNKKQKINRFFQLFLTTLTFYHLNNEGDGEKPV